MTMAQVIGKTTTAVMEAITTTTTVAAVTTTVRNVTMATIPEIKFEDIPGEVFDVHKMAAVDWDEVYDGTKLGPRHYTSWNAINIVRLALSTWIVASHVAIIVFILGKRALRTQPKNLLIVNVALANMFLGVFVVPVKLHFILNPDTVQCDLAMGWTFITHYFQTSVSLYAVFSLVFERFVYVFTEKKQKTLLPLALRLGTVLLLVFPWIMSCMVLLPIFFAAFIAKSKQEDTCLYKVDDIFFLVCQVFSFILPSIGVFILAPCTGLLDCLRPSRCFYKPLTPKGESMAITAVVSFFSIFCEAPYCVVMILMTQMECNNPYCTRFSQSLTMAMWIRICKSAIFPFFWLFYTDIRAAMCIKKKRNDATSDDDDEIDGHVDDETLQKRQTYPLTPATPSTSATVVSFEK